MSNALIEYEPTHQLTFGERMLLQGALQCGTEADWFVKRMMFLAIARSLNIPYSLAAIDPDGFCYSSARLDYETFTGEPPMPTPQRPRVHCPACGDSQIGGEGQEIYRCEKCGGMFDTSPDEGGDYDDRDPSRRLQRQEWAARNRQRRRHA